MNTHLLRNALLLILVLIRLQLSAAFAQLTNSNFTGPSGGNWGDPMNWTPAGVPNNSGTATFAATVDNKTVTLDIDATISHLTTLGNFPFLRSTDHSLTSAATDTVDFPNFSEIDFTANQTDVKLDLGNYAAFSGTTLDNTARVFYIAAAAGKTATWQFNGAHIVESDGVFTLAGAGTVKIVDENGADALRDFTRNLVRGYIHVTGGQTYTFPNSIINEGELVSDFSGTMIFGQNLTQIGDSRDPDGDTNGGYLIVTAGSATSGGKAIINGVLTNYDPVTKALHRGRFNMDARTNGIATIQVLGGDPFDIVNNDSSILLFGPGAAILDRDGADALRNLATNHRLRIARRDFTSAGSLSSGSNADTTALLAVRGASHMTVSGDLTILSGSLEVSPLTSYTLSASKMDSLLKVQGNLSLAPEGHTRFEIFGPPGAVGKIEVTGRSTFAGDLQIFVLPNAPLFTSGSVTVLTTNLITGQFSNVASGGRVTAYKPIFTDGVFDGVITGTVKATYDTASLVISDFQPHASMLNISTRLKVQTGDNALIGGFIVRGIGPKKMIVRGMGPSLSANGVPGVLQDPTLELHDSTGAIILSNDNWQDTQAVEIQATGIAPGDPHESAIVATLDPGSYTAVMRGVNNTTGVGLVEAYDLDAQPGASELVNISTRGRVETGDNVIIGGYIVGAPEAAKLVARGIGPSLAASNVPGSLQDPTLELHDASGATIMSNDNWQDDATQAGLIQSAGLAPTDPRESALAVTLNPGSYTAIVRGKNETEGVALVEFYKLN
jgi:hypothetical protein